MKKLLKNIINSFGYRIVKVNKSIEEKSEPFKVQQNLLLNKDQPCIFDIGAHYGETAIHYSSLFPSAIIYSFEPFSEAVIKFSNNTRQYKNIKIFEQAFSNVEGEALFNLNSSNETNSLLTSKHTDSWIDSATKTNDFVKVKTNTLDNFCRVENITNIDILKIDVQGGEMLVLEGATQLLTEKKIKLIFAEVEFIEIYADQPLFHDITTYLSRFDYQLFGIYHPFILENGQMAWGDAIYIPKE